MSFISFLKKAGMIIANVAAVEAGLAPVFKQAIPQAAPAIDKLDLVVHQIVGIEGAFAAAFPGQQTGAQKVVAAASLIGPILSSVDAITGKHIQDESAYVKAVQTIAGGVADLLNSIGDSPSNATVAASIVAPGVTGPAK